MKVENIAVQSDYNLQRTGIQAVYAKLERKSYTMAYVASFFVFFAAYHALVAFKRYNYIIRYTGRQCCEKKHLI